MTDVILTEIEDNSGMLAAINDNFDKLETAINLSLSKAVDAVNTLHTVFDANSQRLINLPAPVDGTDAARLVDITGTGSSTTLPSVSGQAGKFLGNDGTTALWTSFSTLTIPASQITGDLTGNAENVNGTVAVAHGGTGATTLTGYIKGAGTSAFTAASTIPGTDISGNIAGNAAGLTTTLAIGSGGTGQTTAPNAINALVPDQTGNGGKYLSTNGSVVSWQSAPSGGGGGTVTDITAGAGLTGGLITISGAISITDTGVTAASYGAASKTLTATVNSRGQLTSLAETPIAITGAQVSGDIAGNAAGLTTPLAITSGGTGQTSAPFARTALGATTVGSNVFTAVDAAAARAAIGAGTGNGNGTVTSITQGAGLSFSATPLTATGTISIDSTVVTLTGAQTITNKTITFPIISSISNTGTLTLPTSTDTIVGRITTDTLQNKTMSGTNNTFSNIPLTALSGGPFYVDTIAAMVALVKATLTDGQTISVNGYYSRNDGGGGDFVWDSASTTTANSGTCFQAAAGGTGRWLRLFRASAHLDVRWFGCKNDGTPCTALMQECYDYAANNHPWVPNVIKLVAGYWDFNLTAWHGSISVIGEGRPQVRPAVTSTPVITVNLTTSNGRWRTRYEGMYFNNDAAALTGTGIKIETGINNHSLTIQDCRFQNFDKSIWRIGSFTMSIFDCVHTTANYGVYSTDGTSAHAGDVHIIGGEMTGIKLAGIYIDSVTSQTGNVNIRNITAQAPFDGYFTFIKAADTSGTGVPTIHIENCWNEGTAQSATPISVGGISQLPFWLYAQSATAKSRALISITNTPVGPYKLVKCSMFTYNCDLTYTVGSTYDEDSVVYHEGARQLAYNGIPGITRSVNDSEGAVGTGSWLQMPSLMGRMNIPGATVLMMNDCQSTFNFTGSATTATTSQTNVYPAVGLSNAQRLAMTASQLENSPFTGAISANMYLVAVVVARLAASSGTNPEPSMYLWGNLVGATFQMSSPQRISSADFRVYKIFNYHSVAMTNLAIEMRQPASTTSSVDFGGIAILGFTNRQLAMDFLNSSVFPV